MRNSISLLLTILILSPLLVRAETPPPALSLTQAVATAWAQSPVLAGVRAEVPAAAARLELARSGGRLIASTTTFLSTGSLPNNLAGSQAVDPRMYLPSPPEAQADQNLMLMYPVSTGGRVSARVGVASANLTAAQAEAETALLDVAYSVRTAYWQVLLDQALVQVQEANVTEQTERLRVDEVEEQNGKIPRYYVLRGRADLADAQQELTNARRDTDVALLRLQQLMGVEPGAPLTLSDALVYTSAAVPPAADLVAEAQSMRPEMLAALARLDSARRQVALARASYSWQVEATAMGDAFANKSSTDAGYSVGVVASVPLATGGARSAEVAEAQAMLRKADTDRAALALEISQGVRSALLDLAAADQNVKTAEAAQAAAEEDYRVALLRYRSGKAINLEPISALTALVRAQTRVVQATFEERVASDAVQRAVGNKPAP